MANRTARENGHIGRASTNVHQSYAQFFLIRCQHRATGSQGVEHQHVHIQATTAHTFHDVLGCTLRTSHDMHLRLQANSTHANRLFDILAVDHKLLRFNQQQALIGGDVDGLGGLDHPGNIGCGDLSVLHRNHATGIDAADMTARDAGIDACDFAVGHQLRFLQSLLNALNRCINVDDHTPL